MLTGHSANVVLALWTTSAARIRLFRAMKQIVDAPGCRLLYTDTDSLIYSCPEGSTPLELGECLGELKDEYPNKRIVEFICGGAKQYALKVSFCMGEACEHSMWLRLSTQKGMWRNRLSFVASNST